MLNVGKSGYYVIHSVLFLLFAIALEALYERSWTDPMFFHGLFNITLRLT